MVRRRQHASTVLSANLLSPFDGSRGGLGQTLKSVINTPTGMDTELGYTASGKLSYVFFPYGGSLAWCYGNSPFAGGATLCEVGTRTLSMSSGAPALVYPVSLGCRVQLQHLGRSGGSERSKSEILVLRLGQHASRLWARVRLLGTAGGYGKKKSVWSFWTSDALGRPYLSSSYNLFDNNTSNSTEDRTDQVLDPYGNAPSISQYDFGAPVNTG